ncbi:MAG: 4Fe-4S dicluster domain-containing protein [Cyclobacteriaceae bacterium]|jgi:molybdopterin-containing oxidoreductase family iron-sulfur binding subunit|nr:4Fe-4S dicluster domain-containing protein [Cyclobacteriaceae bacterium]MDH4297545.1 4Fe-4S dicluster domain-containing protein [Cyclobacteriaceae bacterium]MDH5250662.1 4Fe-4S dicluster domain-containing protein [Cyclobacteriaceae bacterium]
MNADSVKSGGEALPRRNFLKGILLAGAAAGCSTKDPFTSAAKEGGAQPSGEMVQLLSTTGEIIEVDKAFLKPTEQIPSITGMAQRMGIEGKKFVMVIDLSRCKNLKKCQESCNHAHFVSDAQNWIKIYPMQEDEHTAPYWQPTTCMHCDEPPCVKVCPVDATFKRIDGIVGIDADRCIGCRFCMAACPYSTRVFNWDTPQLPPEVLALQYSSETSCPPKIGTVSKCDFCPDMVRKGELPHCVSACPNGVFFFGDMNEDVVTNGSETVRFSELIRDKAGYRLMEDLGTKPSVYYLPPVDRLFPFKNELQSEEG